MHKMEFKSAKIDEELIQSVCILELFLQQRAFSMRLPLRGVHVRTRLHLTEARGGSEAPINPYRHVVNCPSYTLPQRHP